MTSAGRPRRDGDAARAPRVVPRSGPGSVGDGGEGVLFVAMLLAIPLGMMLATVFG